MDGGAGMAGGRIGPNAITRMAEAMRNSIGEERTRAIFAAAGLEARLDHPPEAMVPEREVTLLHRAARDALGTAHATQLARRAGMLTGQYLLAHRIPKPVQWLLRALPAPVAARLLVKAIARHAWTFAGSGRFSARPGNPLVLEVAGGPIALAGPAEQPVCDFYTATFGTLFRALVNAEAQVVETQCTAMGATSCLFEVRW
jgi:divinyl protochlorophyllide a 8-vinyl-reductase